MSDCSSCPSNGKCGNDSGSCGVKNNPVNKIKYVIGVMSGKGGVGKSTVSALLAKTLRKQGYKVGLMDADVTGPSAARLMGLSGKRAFAENKLIIPVENEDGIKVLSLNMMLEDENQPVIWRGSLLSNCVQQFWGETNWGELDYLVIDMPPGTGDITLTVMQSIPLSGVVMVSLPQDMVGMIVNKSINMAKMMNINILGIVENMSYMLCPHCGEKIRLFAGDNAKLAAETGVELLCELPTDPTLSALSDNDNNVKADILERFDYLATRIGDKLK